MLILTRKIGESIRIGDDVIMTVLGIKGNQIRLGFDAPKEIIINREEVHKRGMGNSLNTQIHHLSDSWGYLHS